MRLSLAVAAAALGSCLAAVPASAAPLPVSKTLSAQADGASSLLQVQLGAGQQGGQGGQAHGGQRSGGARQGGGGGQRHGGGGGGGSRGDHGGGGDNGGAVAAGVLGGLLLGAIIANEAQRGNAVDDCARRYRSYDRGSQTFIGGDGRRYRCP